MKTIKIIDILVKKANGEEIPKIIEYRTNYYKLVERVDGNNNYRLIDYPSMRECDSYLEDDYYMINILNHEVEIIEDTPKGNNKIEKPILDTDNDVNGSYDIIIINNVKYEISKTERYILDKISEIIDKVNGE